MPIGSYTNANFEEKDRTKEDKRIEYIWANYHKLKSWSSAL